MILKGCQSFLIISIKKANQFSMDRDIRPTLTPELEKKLGDIVKDLETSLDIKSFWSAVVQRACMALSAEAGTFFELAEDKSSLKVIATFGVLPDSLSRAHYPL